MFFGSWIAPLDETESDKKWDIANNYYQLELYDKALPLFEEVLKVYIEEGDKAMITTTQACLAFTCYNLDEIDQAKKWAYSINWKYKIEDATWNRSLSDLFGLFGDDDLQIKYLKRAKKYE